MYLPDYKGGSIVNLMSSIAGSLGGKTPYAPLKLLPPKELKGSKNVVLIVIDALGLDYLNIKKGSFLKDNLAGSMTSVFLPTTASAITTFFTGVAPQQHALTGWHMHLKELGVVTTTLFFRPRAKGQFDKNEVEITNLLSEKGFAEKIRVKSFEITREDIINEDFNLIVNKKAKRLGYSSLNGFSKQISKAINSGNQKKYIFAYWPELDSLIHQFGKENRKVGKHFIELDNKIKRLVENPENKNTTFIITSDHGAVSTPLKKRIIINDLPKLQECLTLPLCGEGRVVYCYVHPAKSRQFEKYVKTKLKKFCHLFKSQELLDKNYFGLGKPNPKLIERIGDYTLIMKDNYYMRDFIAKEKDHKFIGHHAGVSKEEMIVPLIVIKT